MAASTARANIQYGCSAARFYTNFRRQKDANTRSAYAFSQRTQNYSIFTAHVAYYSHCSE